MDADFGHTAGKIGAALRLGQEDDSMSGSGLEPALHQMMAVFEIGVETSLGHAGIIARWAQSKILVYLMDMSAGADARTKAGLETGATPGLPHKSSL